MLALPATGSVLAERAGNTAEVTAQGGSGSFSGTVTDESSNPIQDANVCAEDFNTGEWFDCVTTDASGNYTFPGLATGTYRANAQAAGYANELYDNVPYLSNHDDATPFDVTDGVNTPNIDFALAPGGTISGTVYDETGTTPLGGVPVDTRQWGGFGTCTETDGTFIMQGLPLDTDIYVMAGGVQWGGCDTLDRIPQFWDHQSSLNDADAIVLTVGNKDATGINFSLAQGGSISGTVYNEDSSATLEGVGISIEDADSGQMYDGGQSAADGTYTISGLPAGDYHVWVNDAGYAMEYYNNKFRNNPDRVTVSPPGDTGGIDFTLAPGATISGRVVEEGTGTPIANMTVGAGFDGWGHGTCTDENGYYTLENVPLGVDFKMNTGGGNNWCGGSNNYAQEYWQETPNDNQAHVFNLTVATKDQTGIDFTLEIGGTITGRVTASDGSTPLANIVVGADFGNWGQGACTDSNGYYTLGNVPVGVDFRMNAGGNNNWCGGSNNYMREFWQETPSYDDAVVFNLTSAGETRTNINFTLEEGGSVSGTVTDQNGGLPLENMVVSVHLNGWGIGTCTDASGQYTIDGVPLTESFRISVAGGDHNWCGGSNDYIEEFWNEKFSWDSADMLSLSSGTPDLTGIDFTPEIGGTVSGRVLDAATGMPLANMAVRTNADGWGQDTCTDADGYYTLRNVLLGSDFKVSAGGGNYWCGGADNYLDEFWQETPNYDDAVVFNLSLATKDRTGIDFTLKAGGVISGTVTEDDGVTPINWAFVCASVYGINENGICTRSNPDGSYYITVPGGTWQVWADATDSGMEYYKETTRGWATPVRVTASSHVSNVNFTLGPGVVVSGRVTDAVSGLGIPNVAVEAGFDSWSHGTCTDENGYYTLESIPLGHSFIMQANLADWCTGTPNGYLHEFYNEQGMPEAAQVFDLTEAERTQNGIDFTLSLYGSISGTVYEEDGTTPIANATVWREGMDGFVSTTTDSNGTYTLAGVTVGTYHIGASAPGYALEFYLNAFRDTATDVDVNEGDAVTNINFTLAPGGSISGTVVDAVSGLPLANIQVNANSAGWKQPACTDANGHYTLQSLPLGTNIMVGAGERPNDCGGSEDYITEYWQETYDWQQATLFNLDLATKDQTGIDFTLSTTMRIPSVPTLRAPRHQSISPDTTPIFKWSKSAGATSYEIELDDDPLFGSPVNIGPDTLVTTLAYTVPDANALPYGVYYWRVRAINDAQSSEWSEAYTLEVTIHKAPKQGDFTTDTTPTFRWAAVTGVTDFQLQITTDDSFATFDNGFNGPVTGTSYTPAALGAGQYFWRMSVDGGTSWTPAWTVTITPVPLGKPVLSSPANKSVINDVEPTLQWEELTDSVSYQIQIDRKPNFASPLQDVIIGDDEAKAESYIAAPLFDSGLYYWRVRAFNAVGVAGKWSSPWSFNLAGPARPTLLTPTNNAMFPTTSPELVWAAVDVFDTYQVQVSADKSFSAPVKNEKVVATNYFASDLADGLYYWRVRTLNAQELGSDWSVAWRFTVDTTGPDSPVLKAPGALSGTADTTPIFRWSKPKGATAYKLQISIYPSFGGTSMDYAPTSTKFVLPDEDALDFGRYYWRVQAQDALGNWGDWSSPFDFTVTNLKSPRDTSTTKDSTPTFRWAAVAGVPSYQIQIAEDVSFSTAVPTEVVGTSYTPAVALSSGLHYWRVSIDGGDTWTPAWSFTVTPSLPGRPRPIELRNRTLTMDSNPTFSWQPVAGAVAYEIQVDNDKTFVSPSETAMIGDTMYMVAPLPDGVYYWQVRAVNVDGAPGPWSSRWTFTIDTTAPVAPAIIGPAEEARVTNAKLKLTWGKVSDAVRYEIQVDVIGIDTFEAPVIDMGRKTAYKPPVTLTQGQYYWRVRAIDKAGNVSVWSPTQIFHIVAGNTTVATPDNPIIVIPDQPPLPPNRETPEPPTTPDPGEKPADPDQPPVAGDESAK